MNPEQPSREQIEARITALLLGELPAAEAELLRWTISQDPELQKLQDQLKLTIGFVREAMKNPAGVPVERDTPLKLAQERRQKLLAHFKTARPQSQQQPQQELSWLKRIKIPSMNSLVVAAIAIFLICGLVAISIPNFVKARSTSQENACINNLRQIDAAKNEWALEKHMPADAVPTVNDITPYLAGNEMHSVAGENYTLGKVSEPTVADFNGKRLTAGTEYFVSGEDQAMTRNSRPNNSAGLYESQASTISGRQTARSPRFYSGKPTVTPTPAPIALPNSASPQQEAEGNAGTVYSQSVVGYVNARTGGYQEFANQLVPETSPTSRSTASGSAGSLPERQPAPKTEVPSFTFAPSSQSEASTASPFANRLQSQLAETQTAPTVAMASPPPESPAPELQPQTGSSVPVVEVSPGGSAPASAPSPEVNGETGLPVARSASPYQPNLLEAPEVNGSAGGSSSLLGSTVPTMASKSMNSSDEPVLMPPRMRQQYGQRNAMQPPPQIAEQITPIPALSAAPKQREQELVVGPTAEMPSAPPPQIRVGGVTAIQGGGEAQIPPAPTGGTYNLAELGAGKSSATGINSFGGGVGGIGGLGSKSTFQATNGPLAWSWAANDMNLQAQSKSLSDSKKDLYGPIENGVFQNGMHNGQVYANNSPSPNVTGFNFSDLSSYSGATNGIVLDGDRNLGFGGRGNNQSALPTREAQNAQTVSDSATGVPSARDQVYAYNLHNADPNEVAAVLRNLFPSAGRGVDQSALITRETQNASSVGQTSDSLQAAAPASTLSSEQAQYQQEEGEIQQMQNDVEQLRKRQGIRDTDPMAQAPTPILSTEQLQALNEKLVEQKALNIKLEKEMSEFQAIQATNPTELATVLVTVNPDTTLSGLLDKLHENQQTFVGETNYLAGANPDLASTVALNDTLKQQIKDRVAGIIYGYEAQLAAADAQVAGFTNQLNEFEEENQAALNRDQDYWTARAKLQNQEDLHKMLGEKIEADEADASMPKAALVTVINPATPAQSQSFWQRMTGTFESKAQIELQPDINTSSTHSDYASYDPYFMETEVKSIQSDAVLGAVVDSLKLGDSEKLSRSDAVARLRSQLDLNSDRNTKLIDVGVKSDKPDEAAKIANAVAEAYKQYRLEVHSNEMAAGIERLQEEYAGENREIRQLQMDLAQRETPSSARQAGGQQYAQNGQMKGFAPRPVKQADMPLAHPPADAPIPQPEVQTADNAFSTFSLNVSDVSFKLAMASLQKGQMPDPASIRSEEFINAFDYHDPEPLQGEPLAFVSERASDPFAQERDLLRFSIKAAAAGRQDGRALNLVLLLDTSGSMERADRVAIIREALRVLSSQLQPQDTISVVTFARTARLWADGVPGDQAGATLDKVGSITPEGGTNLEEAMRLAYETALRHFIAGGMNRVVMLTDGAANLGNVDPQALTQKVDAERRQGISLDCFGIGWDDYNDDLLEQLSSNGDGRYAFINSPDEAATEFAAKLAGALQVAAEDVKVQMEFNPSRVTAWRQIGYAKHQLTKQQFRDNSVAAGAIAAREAGNALYAIETNPNGEGPIATVRVRYRVPGTQDVQERSWLVDYTGAAPDLAQSSAAMRLAATAAEISEWMADSLFAQDVTPDELLNYLSGVPQFYGTDERPKQLEWMIREAKSVSGK